MGKNCILVETDEDAILVDVGLMFPDEEMLGVDLVIPDISYVREHLDRLRAVFITHGHEDHIGALPYLLGDLLGIPIYATRLTHGLISARLKEHRLLDVADLRDLRAWRERPGGSVHGHALRRHAQHPRRRRPGDRHARRADRPLRRLQVRPDAHLRRADRSRGARRARPPGRARAALRLRARREARSHALGAGRRRGARHARRELLGPRDRRHLRLEHLPHPAGGRRRGPARPQGRARRAEHGPQLPGRPPTSATSTPAIRSSASRSRVVCRQAR